MSERRELTSWKEIAGHLKVAVRTAQYYEKQDKLPVHRGQRGQVFAFTDELDKWKFEQPQKTEAPAAGVTGIANACVDPAAAEVSGHSVTFSVPRAKTRMLLAIVLVVGCGLLLPAFLARKNARSSPAKWEVLRGSLIVRDQSGRQVWHADLGDLDPQAYEIAGAGITRAVLKDIDGDGTVETLFVARRTGRSDVLMCFGADGTVRWRFTPGRPVRTATEAFENRYNISTFQVTSLRKDGPLHIVLAASQVPYYPTQISVLSHEGTLLREYWHSGHLAVKAQNLVVADVDTDGVNEIYLGGVDNARRQGTLVVLDPENMQGAAWESDPAYQLQGFLQGREFARIFFPRSCMNLSMEPFNSVRRIQILADTVQIETLETWSKLPETGLSYELSPTLKFRSLEPSGEFASQHDRLEELGKLGHKLDVELERLRAIAGTQSF